MTPIPQFIEHSWTLVALSKHVKAKPVRRLICGTPVVIFRAGKRITALIDRCPHRNFPLSQGTVVGEAIECPYHGWSFDQDGGCIQIPGCKLDADAHTKFKAQTCHVHEIHGVIFVKIGDAGPPTPDLPPLLGKPGYDHFWWAQGVWIGRAFDAIENVLDPFHTNYIHDGFIRQKAKRVKVNLQVKSTDSSIEMIIEQTQPDTGLMSRFLEKDRQLSFSRYLPPTIVLAQWEGVSKMTLSVSAFFTPETEGTLRPFACFTTPKGIAPGWLKQAAIRLFLWPVVAQDRRALETQSRNMESFKSPKFKTGPGDLLGNQVQKLYAGEKIQPSEGPKTEHYL